MKNICFNLLSSLAAVAPTFSFAEQVNIFNWDDYLDEEVIVQFEQATGHTVSQDYFASEQLRSEVIDSERGIGFDLILIDSWSLRIMAQKELFHDISNLKLSQNSNDFSRQACGDYGVPYAYGTLGLLYRDSVSDEVIDSWSDLFEPPVEHQGYVSMYADIVDGIAAALLAVGADPFTSDKKSLQAAYQLIKQQAPYVLTYEYGDSYIKREKDNSQLTLTLGYSGDLYDLNKYTPYDDWQYVVPKEGTLVWVECFAFPKGRTIKPAAVDFMTYLQMPTVNIKNAESMGLATPNEKAIELGSEEYLQDENLFPPQDLINKSYLYTDIAPEGQLIRHKMLQRKN